MDGQWQVVVKGASQGNAGEANVDQSAQALHESLRPTEYVLNGGEVGGGHYSWGGKTGTLTSFSNTSVNTLLAFRWNNPRLHCLVNRIRVGISTPAVQATATVFDMAVWFCRNWLINDSGTNQALINRVWPKRTGLAGILAQTPSGGGGSSNGGLIVANTTALTGDAVVVPDRNPISIGLLATNPLNAVGAMSPLVDLIAPTPGSEHGIFLTRNEGFRVGSLTGSGGGGTPGYIFYFFIDWTELPVY